MKNIKGIVNWDMHFFLFHIVMNCDDDDSKRRCIDHLGFTKYSTYFHVLKCFKLLVSNRKPKEKYLEKYTWKSLICQFRSMSVNNLSVSLSHPPDVILCWHLCSPQKLQAQLVFLSTYTFKHPFQLCIFQHCSTCEFLSLIHPCDLWPFLLFSDP